jgi:hypothetical protein
MLKYFGICSCGSVFVKAMGILLVFILSILHLVSGKCKGQTTCLYTLDDLNGLWTTRKYKIKVNHYIRGSEDVVAKYEYRVSDGKLKVKRSAYSVRYAIDEVEEKCLFDDVWEAPTVILARTDYGKWMVYTKNFLTEQDQGIFGLESSVITIPVKDFLTKKLVNVKEILASSSDNVGDLCSIDSLKNIDFELDIPSV